MTLETSLQVELLIRNLIMFPHRLIHNLHRALVSFISFREFVNNVRRELLARDLFDCGEAIPNKAYPLMIHNGKDRDLGRYIKFIHQICNSNT